MQTTLALSHPSTKSLKMSEEIARKFSAVKVGHCLFAARCAYHSDFNHIMITAPPQRIIPEGNCDGGISGTMTASSLARVLQSVRDNFDGKVRMHVCTHLSCMSREPLQGTHLHGVLLN